MASEPKIKIAWVGKHFGEEPPLVGSEAQGAGGIFFSGCHLHCVFCQNFQISQEGMGQDYSIDDLVKMMLNLQNQGAVNIDLVTPTIWWQQIKQAIIKARAQGLTIPIMWNSNGYENVSILKEMEGLVDIYLPDFKYGDDEIGLKYSGIAKYSEITSLAIKEMLRQVGQLQIKDGLATKGVIVRHMILPNNLDNTFKALEKIAEIDKDVHFSLMTQYGPIYKADQYPEVNRKITQKEFDLAFKKQMELGLENGWVQELESAEMLVPDFTKPEPFE